MASTAFPPEAALLPLNPAGLLFGTGLHRFPYLTFIYSGARKLRVDTR